MNKQLKWNYKEVFQGHDIRPLCESLMGQTDDDISQCKEGAVVLINAPSGKSSLHCKDHANERFLGLPPMFSQTTS